MRKMKLLTLMSFLLIGCAEEPEFVGIENVVVTGMEENSIAFSLDYKAYNPNNFNSKLSDAFVNIYYSDQQVGSGIQVKETRLHKNDTITVPLNCTIEADKVTRYIPELLAEKAPKFLIKGEGKVKVFPGKIHLSFEEEVTLNIRKELMKQFKSLFNIQNFFAIKKVEWQKTQGRFQVKMNAIIDWHNPFPIEYKIISQDITIGLKGNKRPLSRITSNTEVQVKKNARADLPLTFEQIDLTSLMGTGISLFLQQEAELWLDGKVVLEIAKEKVEIPVETLYQFKLTDLADLH